MVVTSASLELGHHALPPSCLYLATGTIHIYNNKHHNTDHYNTIRHSKRILSQSSYLLCLNMVIHFVSSSLASVFTSN